jgi:demethylmenaquinone methyltransferase/2-methoxy-6-polyprenyl-1,4-benzoquinol methylase
MATDGNARQERPLQKMFSAVPRRYDLINRLFTFRLDEAWRRSAAVECLKEGPRRLLDLCTGTGDLAAGLAFQSDPEQYIAGVDFSMPMLEKARSKTEGKAGLVQGDAACLPFREGSFNAIGIAFAFRNLTFRNVSRDRYLSEILRILSPGGKFVIIESSQPRSAVFRALVHWYMRSAVSFMGGFVSGQRGAYKYLAHSAINFYGPDELTDLLVKAGFIRVRYRLFLFGAAALHVAFKNK